MAVRKVTQTEFEGIVALIGAKNAGSIKDWMHHPNGEGLVQKSASVDKTAFVSEGAMVWGDARVLGNAQILGSAQVFDSAIVADNAKVSRQAKVYGYAKVSGNAELCCGARVFDNARIFGDVRMHNGKVYENARVYGNASVSGDGVKIRGYSEVYGNASVSGDAVIESGSISGIARIMDKAIIDTSGISIVIGTVCGKWNLRRQPYVGIATEDFVCESEPGWLSIGCQNHSLKTWLAYGEGIAKYEEYENIIAEYRVWVETYNRLVTEVEGYIPEGYEIREEELDEYDIDKWNEANEDY